MKPELGQLDLHLFREGKHPRLHEKLGSHPDASGTSFAAWAPSASAVSVIGDWNGWSAGADKLRPRDSSGVWEGVIKSVGHGTRYKFAITGPDGTTRDKADPFAARSEHPPMTASIVWQPAACG